MGSARTCLLLLGAAAGCGDARKAPSAADSVVVAPRRSAPVPIVTVTPLPAPDSVRAHALQWTGELVMDALASAGLSPLVRGSTREPFMGIPGVLIDITGGEVEMFIYGDANAAARDVDQLDTLVVGPRGQHVVWRKPPALVNANNLVLIVLTADPAVRTRVRNAIDPPIVHPPAEGRP